MNISPVSLKKSPANGIVDYYLEGHLNVTPLLDAWGEWAASPEVKGYPTYAHVMRLTVEQAKRRVMLTPEELETLDRAMTELKNAAPEDFKLLLEHHSERRTVRALARRYRIRTATLCRRMRGAYIRFHNVLVRKWAGEHRRGEKWVTDRLLSELNCYV